MLSNVFFAQGFDQKLKLLMTCEVFENEYIIPPLNSVIC